MRTDDEKPWQMGFVPERSPQAPTTVIRATDAPWVEWPDTGLAGRDLGLEQATGGSVGAQHVRSTGGDVHGGDWHCYDLDWEFLYVLGGALTLESQEGHVHELVAGSAFCHPAFYFHRDIYRSGDLDVVRLTSPVDGRRFEGRQSELPPSARAAGMRSALYTHEADSGAYQTDRDDGFDYRDLGITALTAGRLSMRVVRKARPHGKMPWHGDGSVLWSMVLSGRSRLETEGQEGADLAPNDAFSVGAGARFRHDTDRMSDDYAAIELRTQGWRGVTSGR